jgi:MinD-like ATPase involved in chromosome partitioning or flagellar assembly
VALIALASAKGSPGVTTTALALAAVWPRAVLLAECDPAGGDIAAGFLRAQADPSSTLLDVALAARRGLSPGDLVGRCLRLSADDRLALLPGVSDPAHVASTSLAWRQLADTFQALSETHARDVLADCGRLSARGTLVDLLARCHLIVIVLRPRLHQVHQAKGHVEMLRRDLSQPGADTEERRFGVLLVGDRPYSPGEVGSALGMPVLGVLPVDKRAAEVFSDGAARGRWLDRSPLVRAARRTVASVRSAAEQSEPVAGAVDAAATGARKSAS